MTYVNVVNGADEDFRDMKAHGIQGVEINTYPAIWVGDEIELAQALKCARRHDLKLAFTIENITLRADRIAAHGITPTPSVMIGALPPKVNCWRRFAELAATCILLVSDCETLAAEEAITGVRTASEVEVGGEVALSDGTPLQSLYTRCVEVDSTAQTLGRHGEKTCVWRAGNAIYIGARTAQHEIPRLLDWLGSLDCPDLINGS
jgi:hypothetical protein